MKELKKYYRQISSWLPCGGKLKKEIMARLRSTVEAYLLENPTADFDALQVHFGTPPANRHCVCGRNGNKRITDPTSCAQANHQDRFHLRRHTGRNMGIGGFVAVDHWFAGHSGHNDCRAPHYSMR